MMKARQYDRRLLTRGIQPNIYSIRESNGIQAMTIEYFHKNDPKLKADIESIVTEMRDAKEYGSILNITPVDFAGLYARFDEIRNDINMMQMSALDELLPLVKCAALLAQKYDVVVTNPPYLGNGSSKLAEYLQSNYSAEKYDLYAAFIRKGFELLKKNGMEGMVTGESWMFLSSFAEMRRKIITNVNLVNMAHLGFGAFEAGFGTTAFTLRKTDLAQYRTFFLRLVNNRADSAEKAIRFELSDENTFVLSQREFFKIEGTPFTYWMNRRVMDSFQHTPLSEYALTKAGIVTGNNDYFMKLWHEVQYPQIEFNANNGILQLPKWVPAHKGGGNTRYYGNYDYVMRLNDLWNPSLATGNMRRGDQNFYFLEGLTWSTLSNKLAFRYSPKGFVYETKGSMCFAIGTTSLFYMLGLLNSSLCSYIMNILSPTLDYNRGSLLKMPFVLDDRRQKPVEKLVNNCVELARQDWDSNENSWDFKRNPLV